jgi:hypothetical protein
MILLPDQLAHPFKTTSDADLVPFLANALLLLVRVEDPSGKLADGLAQCTKMAGKGVAREAVTVVRAVGSPTSGRRVRRAAPVVDVQKLRESLEASAHFMVPLTERNRGAGNDKATRIYVGRLPDCEIVLRDVSVSQRHAWIDCDEDGAYFLVDENSTNGTRVNAEQLVPGLHVDIHSGDVLRFGDVFATVVRGQLLCELAKSSA